jgi:bifunctional non-homologous end joining protein LigD
MKERGRSSTRLRAGGRAVEITHPDRILFPEDGITKGELAEYYGEVAPYMVPHLKDRPLNLERFPKGIGEAGFFQQAAASHYPDWIPRVTVPKAGGKVRHVVVQNAAALVYLANQSAVTLHAWLSRQDRLDRPDQMIFDLDPPPGRVGAVAKAARDLGALLRELALVPFVKTTGSRGYHVLVPLDRKADFDEVRGFAGEVAAELVRRSPAALTTEIRKDERNGRIFVDTLRNAYAHTAVPPFTVRARRGAPVATPISWVELDDPEMHPARFTIRNLLPRLEREPDPWAELRKSAKPLGPALSRLYSSHVPLPG